MGARVTQWGESNVVEYFCRHLVALCVTYSQPGCDEPGSNYRFAAYAGTLIQIRDNVFFLTAGHSLRELEDALQRSDVEIQSTVLADTFGWRRISDHPIPFDLKSEYLFYIDDEQEGLDFGVIALRPYYVNLLAANGMVALSEENWIRQSTVKFDGHLMLGLPAEFTSDRVSSAGEGLLSPTMFRVQRLETPPSDKLTRYQRFIGQLDQDLALQDLKGMSGGPIFGFSLDPEMRYWIVALQSMWNRGRRLVFGCPIPVIGSMLTRLTDEALSTVDHGSGHSHISP